MMLSPWQHNPKVFDVGLNSKSRVLRARGLQHSPEFIGFRPKKEEETLETIEIRYISKNKIGKYSMGGGSRREEQI